MYNSQEGLRDGKYCLLSGNGMGGSLLSGRRDLGCCDKLSTANELPDAMRRDDATRRNHEVHTRTSGRIRA